MGTCKGAGGMGERARWVDCADDDGSTGVPDERMKRLRETHRLAVINCLKVLYPCLEKGMYRTLLVDLCFSE